MRLVPAVSLVVPAALALAASVAPGVQAQTVFTNEAAFTAATSDTTLVTFDAFPTGFGPLTSGGVTISNAQQNSVRVDSAFYSGSGKAVQASTPFFGGPLLVIGLPSPVTALGINIFDLGTFGGVTNLTFTLSNGETGTFFTGFQGTIGNALFAGVTTTTPFSSITFANSVGLDWIEFDNLRFGTNAAVVNPVPEPSEWLAMGMAGTSVMGLMLRARARQRRK